MDFQRLDRIRIAAALVAAVLTGGAALFGVYAKARRETAASYETLAPQINALSEAVEQLRVDVARARQEPPPAPRAARSPGRSQRPARPTAPPSAPGPEAAPAEPAESPPPPESEEPEGQKDPGVVDDIRKRVPIDFEKALEVWKDIKEIRKREP